jgi:hypothetical protein
MWHDLHMSIPSELVEQIALTMGTIALSGLIIGLCAFLASFIGNVMESWS